MSKSNTSYKPSGSVLKSSLTSIGTLFSETAKRNPEKIAIICGNKEISYNKLNNRVNSLTHFFADQNVTRGDCVALLSRNCDSYIEVELAAAKIGAICVNFNWRWTQPEVTHCLNLTSPKLIISSKEYEEILKLSNQPPHLIFEKNYEEIIDNYPADEPSYSLDLEDGLVIIFTSGTTGMPKGALISHRAMIARALIFSSEYAVPKDDTFIAWTPLFHMGSNDFSLATLIRGGTVVVIDGYQPEKIIHVIENRRVHYLTVIPGMIEDFIHKLKENNCKPKPIGMIGAMADLVPRSMLKEITQLLNAPYLNTFGSTETGNPPASAGFIPIGSAPENLAKEQSAFCEIRLVDQYDEEVPDGQPGELVIRGPSLFSGYWGNEEANKEAFRNGWFHMGDVFKRDKMGLINFVDRVKYMIKSGGENIYPAEIEQYILIDQRVSEVVVVRKKDSKWGEVPVAFISAVSNKLSEEDVLDMLKGKIASYKLPKEIHFVQPSFFPRTGTGKVQRHLVEKSLSRLDPKS